MFNRVDWHRTFKLLLSIFYSRASVGGDASVNLVTLRRIAASSIIHRRPLNDLSRCNRDDTAGGRDWYHRETYIPSWLRAVDPNINRWRSKPWRCNVVADSQVTWSSPVTRSWRSLNQRLLVGSRTRLDPVEGLNWRSDADVLDDV